MKNQKYRSTEELFGFQAIGTGLLSLMQWWACEQNNCILPLTDIHLNPCGNLYTQESLWLLWLTTVFGVPQVIAARIGNIDFRHYTNAITAIFTLALSVSLALGQGNNIAVGGYFFLSFASFRCFYFTAKVRKI